MTPETVAQFGLAINAARFLISQDLSASMDNIREFFRSRFGGAATTPDQEALLTDEGVKYISSLMTIGTEILDYVADDVARAEKVYLICLKNASSRGERNKCDREVEERVCETLDRAKLRNAGVLPSQFDTVWKRYGCT